MGFSQYAVIRGDIGIYHSLHAELALDPLSFLLSVIRCSASVRDIACDRVPYCHRIRMRNKLASFIDHNLRVPAGVGRDYG
jgi:hypothetical protein